MEDKYYHKYRSRKWMLTVFIQLTVTGLLAMAAITGGDYAQITTANIVAYNAANAATNWSTR